MNNTRKEQQLRVAGVKPGDYPLGSIESRAAARALLSGRENSEINTHMYHNGVEDPETACLPHGPNDINVNIIHVGGDGVRFRKTSVADTI